MEVECSFPVVQRRLGGEAGEGMTGGIGGNSGTGISSVAPAYLPTLAAVFLLALIVRLLNLAFLPLEPDLLLLADAGMYWNEAKVILQHRAFVNFAGEPNTERVPYYYAFLAVFQYAFGDRFMPVLIAQQILDSVSCILIAVLARSIRENLLVPAGLLSAVWPNLWIHSAQILTETLFLFFLVCGLVALVRLVDAPRPRHAIFAGLALGAATMTRPVSQFLLIGLIAATPVVVYVQARNFRSVLLCGAAFTIAAAAPLLPHVVRNLTHFGSFALTSQNGTHVMNWVLPAIISSATGVPREQAVAQMNLRLRQYAENRGISNPDLLNPFDRSHIYVATAVEAIRELPPGAVLKAWVVGAGTNFIVPPLLVDNRLQAMPRPSLVADTSGTWLERAIQFVRLASPGYLTLWVLSVAAAVVGAAMQLAGMILLLYRSPLWGFATIGLVAYFLLINGPITSPKYRLPIEPVLIIWTAVFLTTAAATLTRWRRRAADRSKSR